MNALTFLKVFMIRKGITNRALADKLGVSDSILRGWVDGERRIPVQRFEQFKKVLGIDNPENLSEKMLLPTPEEMGLFGSAATEGFVASVEDDEQVIWQPVGSDLRNFQTSILDKDGCPPILSDSKFLEPLKPRMIEVGVDSVSVWGVKDGKNFSTLNKFLRIKDGDIVMFYSSQSFIAWGRVIGKVESPQWSEELWGEVDFKHIYVLKDVRPISVDFFEATRLVYGKESNSLQSLRILDNEKSELAKRLC